MSVALCIILFDSWKVSCLELTPPSPITTRHLGEQLQTGVVCNETNLFSAAGSHETILSSSILFNITREKWQFVGMTQYGRKAGSVLHHYPEESPSHLSPPAEFTPMWRKMAQVVPCFLRTRSSTLQFSASYQPYSLPDHGIISGFKHQPITTHKQAQKMCATKQPWLCCALVFSSPIITDPPEAWKTNQPTPPPIVFCNPVISLKECHNLEFMTSVNDAAEYNW